MKGLFFLSLIFLEFHALLAIPSRGNRGVTASRNQINVVVDLSHWNTVDFKQAQEDGLAGVIHKATQGLRYVDTKYAERRNAAENVGLLWGAYHFGVGENGKNQADHFLKTVGTDSKVLLALDIEENPNGKTITPKQADEFVNRVHEITGRFPLIYGSTKFLRDFATPSLTKCPLWIAKWEDTLVLPNGWNNWVLWQYTDGKIGPQPHSVKGIGQCDRDKFNGSLEELKNFWGQSH